MQRILTVLLMLAVLTACGKDPIIDASECHNALTEREQAEGWQLLFDGGHGRRPDYPRTV
jgi:hypothetical protein